MKAVIEKSVENAYDYKSYRDYVTKLLKEGKSTGNEQTDELLNYTELNQVRMNRLEKTITISPEVKEVIGNLEKEYIWIVIGEGWCGDVAQSLPIINKMAEVSEKIELKIVFRDENIELMNLFLTDGNRSIPKLLIIDKSAMEVMQDWGPRPLGAKQLILDYKAKYGVVDLTAKTALHKWYADDKGITIQNEIVSKIKEIEVAV